METNLSIQIFGKELNTGRPEMYIKFLNIVGENPTMILWGNICEYTFYNAHNGVLTLLISIGGIGVAFYMIFWESQLGILRRTCLDHNQKIAFISIIALLIHASSESMAIVGTIPYSIFIVVLMRIAKGEITKNDRFTEEGT